MVFGVMNMKTLKELAIATVVLSGVGVVFTAALSSAAILITT